MVKYYLALLISIGLASPIWSQLHIDSLKANLSQNPDYLSKNQILYQLTNYYISNNADSSNYYSNLLIENSKKDDLPENLLLKAWQLESTGRFDEAMNMGYQIILISDTIKNWELHAKVKNLIGNIHISLHEYHQAIKRLKESLKILSEHETTPWPETLFGLGDAYRFLGEYDTSAYYLNQSLKLYEQKQLNDYELIEILLSNSETFIEIGNIEKAQNYLSRVLKLDTTNFSNYRLGYINYIQGSIHFKQNQNKLGLSHYKKAIHYAKAIEDPEAVMVLLLKLISFLEQKSMFEEAFKYQKEYTELYAKVLNEKKLEIIKSNQIAFETSQKEAKIKYQQSEIQMSKYYFNMSIIGILSLVIIGTFLLIAVLKTRKSNQLLQSKNQQIEALLQEVHHRVKNNLQIINSLLGLQRNRLSNPDSIKAIDEMKGRIRTMALIHQNLYLKSFDKQIIVKDYLNDLLQDIISAHQSEHEIFAQVTAPKLEFNIETTLPLGLIVNELITNSIKYALEKNKPLKIKMEIIKQNHKYQFYYADNGNGISESLDLKNLNSFGTKLLIILTQQLKSKLMTSPNKGFEISFEFEER